MSEYSYESSYVSDPAMLAKYSRREFRRRYSGTFIGLCFPTILALSGFWLPEISWVSGLAAGFVITYVTIVLKSYRSGRRISSYFDNKTISIHISDKGISTSLPDFSSQCSWQSIQSLRIYTEYLVSTRHGFTQPVVFPSSALTNEVISFIADQVRKNGGRVVGA